jgi:hypothetical protein
MHYETTYPPTSRKPNDDVDLLALTAARAARTPDLTRKLRRLAHACTKLAETLEANPGDGIGLAYGAIWGAVDEAQTAMMAYQNKPVG